MNTKTIEAMYSPNYIDLQEDGGEIIRFNLRNSKHVDNLKSIVGKQYNEILNTQYKIVLVDVPQNKIITNK